MIIRVMVRLSVGRVWSHRREDVTVRNDFLLWRRSRRSSSWGLIGSGGGVRGRAAVPTAAGGGCISHELERRTKWEL